MVNVFFTDINPEISALNLNYPKLQNKMIIETAQMLVVSLLSNNVYSPMKSFNPKHPSSIWVNESKENYLWTLNHLIYLIKIYDKRTNNTNNYSKSRIVANTIKNNINDLVFKDSGLNSPNLALSEETDLKIKYGTFNGKYYIANSILDGCKAYKEYLLRKSYWLPEYKFVD